MIANWFYLCGSNDGLLGVGLPRWIRDFRALSERATSDAIDADASDRLGP